MAFSGTTPVHDGSVLFTVGRRALHISQHRLLLWNGHGAQQRLEATFFRGLRSAMGQNKGDAHEL
jgi:hypothetical protein